jgi:hypothetical protein
MTNIFRSFSYFFFIFETSSDWVDRGFEPWPGQTKDIKEKEQRLVGSESG